MVHHNYSEPLQYERQPSHPLSKNEPVKNVAMLSMSEDQPRLWKPTALSWPVLVPAIVYNILMIITLGFLIRQQLEHGAVYFITGKGDDAISLALFGYLPILTAVIYSVYWGWVDLSAKRLEPWYQLSKPSGASLASSLALRYPTDFAPFVPWKAARNGHHVVMAASSVMVVIFWAITPLQGALFATTKAVATHDIAIDVAKSLADIDQQKYLMGTDILSSSYSHLWFGESLRPFTTDSYAVLPYVGDINSASDESGGNITYDTLSYETELECWAPVSVNWSSATTPTFDDGRGCVTTPFQLSASSKPNRRYFAEYIGYWYDGQSYTSIGNCPPSAAHRFLGLYARADIAQPDYTNPDQGCALFCEPTYYKQKVRASVSTSSQALQSYTPLEDKAILSDEEFNRTHFEYVLWNGVSPFTSGEASDVRDDFPNLQYVYQDDELANYPLTNTPVPSMVGFSIGTTRYAAEAYMNSTTLGRAYAAAHKLLFVVAISKLSTGSGSSKLMSTSVPASLKVHTNAVTMNTVIAYVLCGFFGVVLFLSFYLLSASFLRPCKLVGDPNSLRRICDNVNDSQIYRLAGQAATRNFCLKHGSILPSQKFGLSLQSVRGYQVELLHKDEGTTSPVSDISERCKAASVQLQKHNLAVPYPLELKTAGRAVFLGILILTLTILCIMYALITSQKGIFFTLSSNLLQQVLLNYIPVLVATIIEPFWVLLARHASTFQPFLELAARPINQKKSLDLTYASLPPQVLQFQALKNGHFLLAALSAATIFANVLSLAMSSLFTVQDIQTSVPIVSAMVKQPQFNNSDIFLSNTRVAAAFYFQPFYLVQSNVEVGTDLPPFLDATNYYIPTDLTSLPSSLSSMQIVTTGIGASLDCMTVELSGPNTTLSLQFAETLANFSMKVVIESSDGQQHTCAPQEDQRDDSGNAVSFVYGDPSGRKAVEIFKPMVAANSADSLNSQQFCSSWTFLAWLRTTTILSQPSNATTSSTLGSLTLNDAPADKFELESTILLCRPRVHVGNYALNITSQGSVLSAALQGKLDDQQIIQDRFFNVTNRINSQFATNTATQYHNDTIASDWSSYLIKHLSNSTDFLDAQKSPPSAERAKQYASDVYARIFAAQVYLKNEYLLTAGSEPSQSKQSGLSSSAGQAMQTRQKLFMSMSMFWLAIAVLAFDMLVAIAFSYSMPNPFLRHVPNCILGVLALFDGSRAMEEFTKPKAIKPRQERNGGATSYVCIEAPGNSTNKNSSMRDRLTREKAAVHATIDHEITDRERDEKLYAYGQFTGADGKTRIGVEIFPYATPINMKQRKTSSTT